MGFPQGGTSIYGHLFCILKACGDGSTFIQRKKESLSCGN